LKDPYSGRDHGILLAFVLGERWSDVVHPSLSARLSADVIRAIKEGACQFTCQGNLSPLPICERVQVLRKGSKVRCRFQRGRLLCKHDSDASVLRIVFFLSLRMASVTILPGWKGGVGLIRLSVAARSRAEAAFGQTTPSLETGGLFLKHNHSFAGEVCALPSCEGSTLGGVRY